MTSIPNYKNKPRCTAGTQPPRAGQCQRPAVQGSQYCAYHNRVIPLQRAGEHLARKKSNE